MLRIKWKTLFFISALLFLAVIAGVIFWFIQLDKKIQSHLEAGNFQPPVEFFSSPPTYKIGEKLSLAQFVQILRTHRFRERPPNKRLFSGDFQLLSSFDCREKISNFEDLDNSYQCITFIRKKSDDEQVALFSEGIFKKAYQNSIPSSFIQLDSQLFAQYILSKPILRKTYRLSKTPTHCLNAVLAIEDPRFLEHQGISLKGIARAFYTNIVLRRRAQGGSTITQQLIKNLLLSHEKTIRRKLTEIAMALIFEFRVSKDQILENYLNLIYMGQNGIFSVNGFGSAAQHYFDKDLSQLSLSECSMLAAVLNSPGRYNPLRHLERARKRQTLVLKKMVEHQFILQEEVEPAIEQPLKLAKTRQSNDPAPYFVDAVRQKIRSLGISEKDGLKIYTTLNPEMQKAARKQLSEGIEKLENWFAHLKKNATLGRPLQGSIVSANPQTGEVEALVGGRSFKKYPYNRATKAHRQVGSIIKPLVYLSALEKLSPEGQPYTPISILPDQKFEHEYEGQTWSPENYDKKFRGQVYLFEALKNSLNSPTASLGLQVGLPSIVDLARRVGIQSKIDPLPAMTLGAYELYPMEVLQAYTTLARFGSYKPLRLIRRIEDAQGKVLFKASDKEEQVIAPELAAVLIGMMKQTIQSGTGQVVRKLGFLHPAAGKTGTTSDARDAWFAGFTPQSAAVVWVGYDDNGVHGLTGASGAAPIWSRYMQEYSRKFIPQDFAWPDSVTEFETQPGVKLIFRKGNEVEAPDLKGLPSPPDI